MIFRKQTLTYFKETNWQTLAIVGNTVEQNGKSTIPYGYIKNYFISNKSNEYKSPLAVENNQGEQW